MVCLNAASVFDLGFFKDALVRFSAPLRCTRNNSARHLSLGEREGGEKPQCSFPFSCATVGIGVEITLLLPVKGWLWEFLGDAEIMLLCWDNLDKI